MSTEPLHIVCPHCHTTNRVPSASLSQAPDCGKCHQPLFTGHPVALDESAFDKHIARSQVPVLVVSSITMPKPRSSRKDSLSICRWRGSNRRRPWPMRRSSSPRRGTALSPYAGTDACPASPSA